MSKKSAFVIMPFDTDPEAVYLEFIKPALERAGLEVARADDIQHQANILAIVIERIFSSDLIVADLTGSNPNVFYELGVAHALEKPVVLITQNVEEIPFDLKPYRLLKYDPRLGYIKKAEEALTECAKGFLKGELRFGNPVTDFRNAEGNSKQSTVFIPSDEVKSDDRGFLDHVVAVNNGYRRITDIMEGAATNQSELTISLKAATKKFTEIQKNPSAPSAPQAAQHVARRLSDQVAQFNDRLEHASMEYSHVMDHIENSLEFIAAFQREYSKPRDPKIDESFSLVQGLRSKAANARDSLVGLAASMEAMPRLERRLNREVERGTNGLIEMAASIDRTIASIDRALRTLG